MPRSSAIRKIAPDRPEVEVRRYQAPRPANDRFSPASNGNRPQPGTNATFGKATNRRAQAELSRSARNALQSGVHLAVSQLPLVRLVDAFETFIANVPTPHPDADNHPRHQGYYFDGECKAPRGPPNGFYGGAWPSTYSTGCLGGQAVDKEFTTFEEVVVQFNFPPTVGHMHHYDVPGGRRAQHVRTYQRGQGALRNRIINVTGNRLNPNFQRWINPTYQPLGKPDTAPAPAPVPHTIYEYLPTGRLRPGPRPGYARAARSTPPKPGTKEIKTKVGKIAAKITSILDRISEGSEVIDAIYKALPKDVRKRWEKGRDLNRQGDQDGQYGVSGADWKVRAIWHNVTKIDVNTALRNIVLNELSDKLYGASHKARGELTFRGRKRRRN